MSFIQIMACGLAWLLFWVAVAADRDYKKMPKETDKDKISLGVVSLIYWMSVFGIFTCGAVLFARGFW